jgi:hypothetical protein
MQDRSRNLDEYVLFIRSKLRQDADNVLIITGLEGSGKSNLALGLCKAISHETFNVREHIAYEPADFVALVKRAPRYGSVLADEGGEIFMANDANTPIGKDIKRTLQQCRRKNLNIIFNVPRHVYLNKTGLFRCHSFMYVKTLNINGRIEKGHGEKWDPDVYVWDDGKRPWFNKRFSFKFPDMRDICPNLWTEYLQFKNEAGDERLDRYTENIKRECEVGPELSVCTLAEMISASNINEQLQLRGARGRMTAEMIYERYKTKGCTMTMARAVIPELMQRGLVG